MNESRKTPVIRHARLAVAVAAVGLAIVLGAATVTAQTGASELVPGGRLRVAVNVGNPVLARKDATTGEVRGVSVDLGRALASRLGVPFVPVEYAGVAPIVDGSRTGAWDVAFLAADPARAADMDFTPPYMEVENTYLVPAQSPISAVADADRAGVRIAVPNRSAPDLFLSGTLRQATLVRGDTEAAAFALLRAGQADAFAANRNSFDTFTAGVPGFRALDDHFLVVPMAVAVPKGRPTALATVTAFLDEAKVSGMVQQSIERGGLRGVRAAAVAGRLPRTGTPPVAVGVAGVAALVLCLGWIVARQADSAWTDASRTG